MEVDFPYQLFVALGFSCNGNTVIQMLPNTLISDLSAQCDLVVFFKKNYTISCKK